MGRCLSILDLTGTQRHCSALAQRPAAPCMNNNTFLFAGLSYLHRFAQLLISWTSTESLFWIIAVGIKWRAVSRMRAASLLLSEPEKACRHSCVGNQNRLL